MTLLKIAALAAALALPALASPAAARSLHDTHARVWSPAAKGAAATYRLLARGTCKTVAPIHLAGKTLTPMHAQQKSVCRAQIALKDDSSTRRD